MCSDPRVGQEIRLELTDYMTSKFSFLNPAALTLIVWSIYAITEAEFEISFTQALIGSQSQPFFLDSLREQGKVTFVMILKW